MCCCDIHTHTTGCPGCATETLRCLRADAIAACVRAGEEAAGRGRGWTKQPPAHLHPDTHTAPPATPPLRPCPGREQCDGKHLANCVAWAGGVLLICFSNHPHPPDTTRPHLTLTTPAGERQGTRAAHSVTHRMCTNTRRMRCCKRRIAPTQTPSCTPIHTLFSSHRNLVDPASSVCFSQRLSHACVSMRELVHRDCERLITTVSIHLVIGAGDGPHTDNRAKRRATTCTRRAVTGARTC